MAAVRTPLIAGSRTRAGRAAHGNALISGLAACAVGAVVFAFFGHAYLNYDTFYALAWGRDLAHGITPDYQVSLAPTPHPLATAIGVPLSLFGSAAEPLALALILFSIGSIAVAVYRLGSELYAWPVGLLAAAIATTRVPLLNFGIRGYVDFPMIALIVWATVLESRRPRRGAPVMAMLAVAGLLRPEAWLFIAAYWLWMAPALDVRGRLLLGVVGASAPIIWGLTDLAVTGDALWSLHGTHAAAAQLHRHRGLGAVPSTITSHLGEIMRLPELIASVIGFVAGLRWLRERTLLPAAVLVLDGVAYLILAAGGLSLITRYLFLAGVMLSLFAALAVFGWLALAPGHPARSPWRIVGAVTLLAIVAFFGASQVGRLTSLRTDIRNRYRVQADLHALVDQRATRTAVARCSKVLVPNHGQIPLVRYWTGLRSGRVASIELTRPGSAEVYFSPATARAAALSVLDPHDPKRFNPPPPGAGPPGFSALARNSSWVAYAGRC